MKKDLKKGENAITLIALIITIIVILILAGVSINAIIGDNGIISQAINVANATDIADTKEQIQVALLNYYDDSGQYTVDDVWSAVDDVLGEGSERDTENYTVQTAKGNTVDISDLIAGAYVYVDTKGPTVTISTSIDGSTLEIIVTATDVSGIDSYEYYLDDELVESTTETTYKFTNLSDGSHTITVVVTDTAGNETEKEVAVVIDTTAPTVAITTSEDTDSITVEVSAEDDNGISSYKYYLDGTLYETLTTESYTFTSLSAGTEYTVKVIVTDNNGNATEVITTVTTSEEENDTLSLNIYNPDTCEVSYTIEYIKGMTWEEWCDSEYNNASLYVYNGYVRCSSTGLGGVFANLCGVKSVDEIRADGVYWDSAGYLLISIEPGETYEVNIYSYSSSKVFYTIEYIGGMTWEEWCDSEYNTVGFENDGVNIITSSDELLTWYDISQDGEVSPDDCIDFSLYYYLMD